MQRHQGPQRQIRGKKALAAKAAQLVGVPAVSFTLELVHWPAASISTRPAHCSQLPLLSAEGGRMARLQEEQMKRTDGTKTAPK